MKAGRKVKRKGWRRGKKDKVEGPATTWTWRERNVKKKERQEREDKERRVDWPSGTPHHSNNNQKDQRRSIRNKVPEIMCHQNSRSFIPVGDFCDGSAGNKVTSWSSDREGTGTFLWFPPVRFNRLSSYRSGTFCVWNKKTKRKKERKKSEWVRDKRGWKEGKRKKQKSEKKLYPSSSSLPGSDSPNYRCHPSDSSHTSLSCDPSSVEHSVGEKTCNFTDFSKRQREIERLDRYLVEIQKPCLWEVPCKGRTV